LRARVLVPAIVVLSSPTTEAAGHSANAPSAIRQDTIVRMAGAPRHPGISRAVPELTIDGSDLPNGGFGSFGDVLWANDGHIWVAEGGIVGPPALYLFDSTGRFVRQVARSGSGPGEYQAPRGLAQIPDGRVLVRDGRLANRLNVYHSDGRIADTWTFATRIGGGPGTPRPVVDTAGFTWIEWFGSPSLTAPSPGGTGFVRVSADGAIVDTVPYPALPDLNPRRLVVGPLSARAGAAVSPLGYVVTFVTSRYAIDLRIPGRAPARGRPATWQRGDQVVSIRRTATPVPVGNDERRDHEAFVRSIARGGAVAPVPSAKPPIRRVKVDRYGRLWAEVPGPSVRRPAVSGRAGGRGPVRPDRLWEEPVVYDVFEADGTLIGTVRFPDGATPLAFERDRVLCFVRSMPDGDIRFVRFRIPWGDSGGGSH
jgi:hypothetical protein